MGANMKEQFMGNPKLHEAMAGLRDAATDAAAASRKFSQDYEAAQRRQHRERLARQERWDNMMAERLSQQVVRVHP